MEDIRRRDQSLFLKELFSFGRVVIYLALLIPIIANGGIPGNSFAYVFFALMIFGACAFTAFEKGKTKRFKSDRYKMLWQACVDRHKRFHSGLNELNRRGVADLQELPKTIETIYLDLYRALRRADIVANEVISSEGWLIASPNQHRVASPDKQAQELYRIADKNIAEYRHHYVGVMSGVERTEAQVAVFTTTLDTLRMKMLGYRLVGKDTESPTQEFLAALTEARMQLESIDKALEELDLTPFPQTVSIIPETTPPVVSNVPPPISESMRERFKEQHVDEEVQS